jgi:hypothetical protein
MEPPLICRVARVVELLQELAADGDVDPALVGGERFDAIVRRLTERGAPGGVGHFLF